MRVPRACLGEQEQRQQAGRLAVVGSQGIQGSGEPDGMVGDIVVAECRSRASGVTHRVGEVDRAAHCRHALFHGEVVGQADPGARDGDALLRPSQPRRHRRLGDEEGGSNRRGRHATPEAHGQGDLDLLGQGRVAAQHDEAQFVVEHGRGVEPCVRRLCGQVARGGDGGEPLTEAGQPADAVECSAPSGSQQPGLDRVGHASVGPGLQGEGEGVGSGLLGDVEVACHPQRGGEHATPVPPLGVGGGCGDVVVNHPRRRSPRSGAPRCSRTAPGSARRSVGRARRRRPRRGSSRRGSP